jgi:cephalosporin-C deacetylase-like acetyl esterase
MQQFKPEANHAYWMASMSQALALSPKNNFAEWRESLRAKLVELVGLMPEPVPANVRIEFEQEHEHFRETRFVFSSEPEADVPCHLLIPKSGKAPFPLVICLQGHSTGMHISLGRARFESDEKSIEGGRDFGLQAVREGYAALVMEQRCFGERKSSLTRYGNCLHSTLAALLLGRTMIGERVWDVSRAIDVMSEFPDVDTSRIACMGNSGGGTITYYAACLEPRIGIAMPSCSVCTYQTSIAVIEHCSDNYLPGALRYFEMGDLAALIAPRPLIVVTGRHDEIFPIDGVEENFENIRNIYAAAGAPENCRLIVGEAGHQFYPEQSWPVLREMAGW